MMTPLTKTWIDRKLSRKERATLVEYLLERTTSPTSEEILAAIGELFPGKEKPGIRSVSDWKAKSWKFEVYLRELETENAKAQLISEKSADIADANKKMVDGYVFKNLEALKNGELDAVDPNIRGWIQAASATGPRAASTTKNLPPTSKDRARKLRYSKPKSRNGNAAKPTGGDRKPNAKPPRKRRSKTYATVGGSPMKLWHALKPK